MGGYHLTKYGRLYESLRSEISSGERAAGARLPSTRALAARLGVSRNTVLTAYEMLLADGLVTTRIGSGTRVRGTPRAPHPPDPRRFLRAAQFPSEAVSFHDSEGNRLYFHR